MIKNYFKVALRNLLKYKLYSFINIAGLAAGLASCLIILVFVSDELSFDKFHPKADNIYRVVTDLHVGGVKNELSVTSFPIAPALKNTFPEIKDYARLVSWSSPIISLGDKKFKEEQFLWADHNVFNIMDFEFIRGNKNTALLNPNEVVLTESTAEKYFGNDNPIGKVLLHDNKTELKVIGVVREYTANSHIRFDFLGSFPTLESVVGADYIQSWHAFFRIYTYVLLNPGTDHKHLEMKFPEFVTNFMQDENAKALGRTYSLSLQPLTDIHLYSTRVADISVPGSIAQVYIVSVIALFILLIACINFTNLSTARAIKRSGEVGLRKVLGAERKQLIFQFIGEAFISSLAAIPLALGAAELFMPYFNSLTDKNLQINLLSNALYPAIGLLFVAVISFFSGAYPAFFLSKFKPVTILKSGSNVTSSRSGSVIRRGLIVVQFAISIFLIICTAVVFSQLEYIQKRDLGLDDKQVVVLPANDQLIKNSYDVFKNNIVGNSIIDNISFSAYMPGILIISTPFKKQAASDNEKFELTTLPVDQEFFKTLGIQFAAGRGYSADIVSDTIDAYVINETAAKNFGWTPQEAVGKIIDWEGGGATVPGRIIGVAKDFHFQSLHTKINPLVFIPKNFWPLPTGYISIRAAAGNMSELIPFLKEQWDKLYTHVPFEHSLLDESFAGFYVKEEKTSKVFTIFAFIAIFIACLGLFGLSAYSVEIKTKEIGIRKVLGSSVAGIIKLISTEFMLLVVIANLIAWPAAYYFMKEWLSDFAYHAEMNYITFISASAAAIIIALVTVSYHSMRAANTNPVKALKYE